MSVLVVKVLERLKKPDQAGCYHTLLGQSLKFSYVTVSYQSFRLIQGHIFTPDITTSPYLLPIVIN